MNKRIRELAEQAGAEFYEGFLGSPDSVKFKEKDVERFIKLIARECAEISKNYAAGPMPMSIALAIKQHFGVEE